jgi:hypothetical protein
MVEEAQPPDHVKGECVCPPSDAATALDIGSEFEYLAYDQQAHARFLLKRLFMFKPNSPRQVKEKLIRQVRLQNASTSEEKIRLQRMEWPEWVEAGSASTDTEGGGQPAEPRTMVDRLIDRMRKPGS